MVHILFVVTSNGVGAVLEKTPEGRLALAPHNGWTPVGGPLWVIPDHLREAFPDGKPDIARMEEVRAAVCASPEARDWDWRWDSENW